MTNRIEKEKDITDHITKANLSTATQQRTRSNQTQEDGMKDLGAGRSCEQCEWIDGLHMESHESQSKGTFQIYTQCLLSTPWDLQNDGKDH